VCAQWRCGRDVESTVECAGVCLFVLGRTRMVHWCGRQETGSKMHLTWHACPRGHARSQSRAAKTRERLPALEPSTCMDELRYFAWATNSMYTTISLASAQRSRGTGKV
jgi:hypothetical protein